MEPVFVVHRWRCPLSMGHEKWGPSLLTLASVMDNPLEKVFRRFVRHVLDLRAGTPTAALLTEAGQCLLRVDILTSLFASPCDTIKELFEQQPTVLTSFACSCRQKCQRLRQA